MPMPRPWEAGHVSSVEPLSVAAFASALYRWKGSVPSKSGDFVLDVGMNVGWYSWLAHAIAPELSLVGIDMQPQCVEAARCGLRVLDAQGRLPANVHLLNRYVSNSADDPTLMVPGLDCRVMASPTAVGGRFPNGKLQKALEAPGPQTPVRPIALGQYLLAHFGRGKRAAVVKIDTEGFETRVLESLRPAWHLLGDIVFELQAGAWRHHNVSLADGLKTLSELIDANNYRVVTLPHTALGVGRGEAWWSIPPEFVDPCRLPHVSAEARVPPNPDWYRGLGNATVMHGHQLQELVRRGGASLGFHEFMLTSRWQGCGEQGTRASAPASD